MVGWDGTNVLIIVRDVVLVMSDPDEMIVEGQIMIQEAIQRQEFKDFIINTLDDFYKHDKSYESTAENIIQYWENM